MGHEVEFESVSFDYFDPFKFGTLTLNVSPKIVEKLLNANIHPFGRNQNELFTILANGFDGRWSVKKVIYHAPATIVYWDDGTKTVVKCDNRDTYSKEAGLALCYMKKILGSSRAFNDVLKEWAE